MAGAAAELLFKKIMNAQAGSPVEMKTAKMLFPAELIIRRSCGCSVRE
jgi:hypothetical protein